MQFGFIFRVKSSISPNNPNRMAFDIIKITTRRTLLSTIASDGDNGRKLTDRALILIATSMSVVSAITGNRI